MIYLAALLDCAPHLEASRLPKDDNEAFAYRFAEGESLRLFEPARGYHQWLTYLSEFGGPENPFAEDRPAIVTDISDFYQRIYFHRIENVLQDAGCPKGQSDLVKKIVKATRARQSYGLPVGSTASRLLAECLLTDTDMLLKNMGLKFTRFVDDFRIAVPPGMEAHSILCRLAEHLMGHRRAVPHDALLRHVGLITGISSALEQQVRFTAIASRPSILASNLMVSPPSAFRASRTVRSASTVH